MSLLYFWSNKWALVSRREYYFTLYEPVNCVLFIFLSFTEAIILRRWRCCLQPYFVLIVFQFLFNLLKNVVWKCMICTVTPLRLQYIHKKAPHLTRPSTYPAIQRKLIYFVKLLTLNLVCKINVKFMLKLLWYLLIWSDNREVSDPSCCF